MSPEDRRQLWLSTGGRCAICQHLLAEPGSAASVEKWPTAIRAVEPRGEMDEPHYIVLCQTDAIIVEQYPDQFGPDALRRLQTTAEVRHSRATAPPDADASSSARAELRTHFASFLGSTVPMVFLKLTNISREPIQVDDIWFATDPEDHLENPARPLPTRVEPGELFETWKPVAHLQMNPKMLQLGRARLSEGTVIASEPNTAVAPAGVVGGRGAPLNNIEVRPPSAAAKWDVFISHANEDKDDVAKPLHDELDRLGVSVWYDAITIAIGDSLQERIDHGIRASRFAVVILSPHYLAKLWTRYEFRGIVTMNVYGKQNLLPIWHRITKDEVVDFSPSLADRVARSTSDWTIKQIAEEIAHVVHST